jgi:hypothetical protein
VFWFYPTLIAGTATGLLSLLGQIGIIPIPKIDIWHKEDTTLISPQTKMDDSTHISTTETHLSKKKNTSLVRLVRPPTNKAKAVKKE